MKGIIKCFGVSIISAVAVVTVLTWLNGLESGRLERHTVHGAAVVPAVVVYTGVGANRMRTSTTAAQQGADVLRALCDLYNMDIVSGDLCNRLCYYYDNWDVLEYYSSTKVVLVLNMAGQKLVLKSQHAHIDDYDVLPGGNSTQQQFEMDVLRVVNDKLKIGFPSAHRKYLIQHVWQPYKRGSGRLSPADRTSLWALVQQEEFNTMAVLPLSRVVPRVTGTCGHFYSVETLVPFKMKAYYANLKAKILIHIMGTLKLFYEFLNEPLHWCDVQFDNFGLSSDYPKRFMIMDADMLFTQSRLSEVLSNMSCRTDDDCRLADCHSLCNTTTRRCNGERFNDNIDVFCAKLVNELFEDTEANHRVYKNNKYISNCHNHTVSRADRLKELRVTWAWSLSDV